MSLDALRRELRAEAVPVRAASAQRYFKTGPGGYAEGDKFLGVSVPAQRRIAKKYPELPLADIKKLIKSRWHEERSTGLFIMIAAFKRGNDTAKENIFRFYIDNTKYINNWDLVDSSAGYIVGNYLQNRPDKMAVLRRLARSELLWDRRIAMIATLAYIVNGSSSEALEIAEILINDRHDLIQKAVGWMLRETGKRCGRDIEEQFLITHYKTMPRTALRYAIEHFSPAERQKYLKGELRQRLR